MGEAERQKTLRQIARTGREEHQARVMTPTRALRLALARAADELFDLPLSVSSVQSAQVGQEQAISAFTDESLLMVFDGPAGAVGAVSVAMPLLAGLIEVQTMGQVLAREMDAREPTQTDAALAAPLLNAGFAGFVENLAGEAEAKWAEGFRFGAMIEGTRMLSLLLEASDFHLFRLQVSLNEGAKEGEILIALPVVLPVQDETGEGPEGMVPAQTRHIRLGEGALMTAKAPLSAVLHRVKKPLAEISALKPGDILNIPREALSNTRLTAGQGRGIAKCRLGQINGFRAVRLVPGAEAALLGQGNADGEPEAGEEAGGTQAREPAQMADGMPGELGELQGIDAAHVEEPLADMQEFNTENDLPDLGDLGGGLEDLPDLGALGGDLSNLSEQEGDGTELPDLPPLDGLGDLSDLPELALDD